MSPAIAAFDCDGTLIRGDATRCCLLLLQGPFGLLRLMPKLLPHLVAWQLKRCSTGRMKEILLDVVLQATPRNHRQRVLEEQLPIQLRSQLRPEALKRLQWHRQQGDRCMIVTASPEPFIRPLAEFLKIELIGTRCQDPLEVSPNQPFALLSANCKGPEKLKRLEFALGEMPSPETLEAYGDSSGDRELLQASGRPHYRSFAAEPRAYRQSRSWLQRLLPWLALLLLGLGVQTWFSLPSETTSQLVAAFTRLLAWLPVIYALLTLSYLGRYCRWRALLHSVQIGHWSWADALGWFQGFALTATPGKLGELSRVEQLHVELGYPRLPLTHVFVAERLCDGAAVLIWLGVITPAMLAQLLPPAEPSWWWLLIIAGLILISFSLRRQRMLRSGWQTLCKAWEKHRPRGAMARACLPALVLSLIFWAVEGLILWLLVMILSPTSISPLQGIGIYLLSGTAGLISNSPGGIGVNEAATTLLLQDAGIDVLIALPIAILRRVLTIWTITAAAGLSQLIQGPFTRR